MALAAEDVVLLLVLLVRGCAAGTGAVGVSTVLACLALVTLVVLGVMVLVLLVGVGEEEGLGWLV